MLVCVRHVLPYVHKFVSARVDGYGRANEVCPVNITHTKLCHHVVRHMQLLKARHERNTDRDGFDEILVEVQHLANQ